MAAALEEEEHDDDDAAASRRAAASSAAEARWGFIFREEVTKGRLGLIVFERE